MDQLVEGNPAQAREMIRQIYLERPEQSEQMAREENQQAHGRPTSLILCTQIFHSEEEQTGEASEERECAICYIPLEEGDKIGRLSGSHNIHAACLKEWLQRGKNRYPLCQARNIAETQYESLKSRASAANEGAQNENGSSGET